MHIIPGDFTDQRVIDLLQFHFAGMHENSPAGSCYVLDLSGVQGPDIDFWTAWNGEELMGCGALRALSNVQGEIKSMRTWPQHLRKGVGAALLDHIVATARSRGYARLSLETGSGDAFEPALSLYRKYGFVPGEPFAGYAPSEFNQFFHLEL